MPDNDHRHHGRALRGGQPLRQPSSMIAALGKGINVNVFAYEGAVSLTMKEQAPQREPGER